MTSQRFLEILNTLLLPVKLIVPQPIIARIPGLTTNEMIRISQVRKYIRNRLLDIGCGTNHLVEEYRSDGGFGIGVDVYPWEGVDIVVSDTAELPFADGSFDTITFVACINHIPNREAALTEAYRLLSPDGKVVITNLPPTISLIWHKIAFWDRDQHERGMAEGEVWGLTKKQMQEILHIAGFKIVHFNRFSLRLNELYVAAKDEQ